MHTLVERTELISFNPSFVDTPDGRSHLSSLTLLELYGLRFAFYNGTSLWPNYMELNRKLAVIFKEANRPALAWLSCWFAADELIHEPHDGAKKEANGEKTRLFNLIHGSWRKQLAPQDAALLEVKGKGGRRVLDPV